jgi:tetratricopeptide (TPR) repeat protein
MCKLEAVYYHERAKALLLTEEYQLAVDDYNKVIEIQPFNSHAFFGRAFAYKNLRQYDKAVSSG